MKSSGANADREMRPLKSATKHANETNDGRVSERSSSGLVSVFNAGFVSRRLPVTHFSSFPLRLPRSLEVPQPELAAFHRRKMHRLMAVASKNSNVAGAPAYKYALNERRARRFKRARYVNSNVVSPDVEFRECERSAELIGDFANSAQFSGRKLERKNLQ